MAGNSAILNFGWTLPNRDAIHDRRVGAWTRARPAHEATAAQVPEQLPLQDVACLNEEASIDGLVRYPHGAIMREGLLKANGDLARRPVQLQVLRDPVPQPWTSRQHTALWPASTSPRTCIGFGGSIALNTTISIDLPAYRGSCAPKAPANVTDRKTACQTARDLFALFKPQLPGSATSGSRSEPAVAL